MSVSRKSGWWAMALCGWATLLLATGSARADAGHAQAPRGTAWVAADDVNNARVIVKYRSGAALSRGALRPRHALAMGRRLALPLTDGWELGERTQALRGRGLSSAALAARLSAQPDVEWAVVDRRRSALQATPNDPYFGDNLSGMTPTVGQWYLRAPGSSTPAATNALGAWAITTGSASITVAVLDTGVRFQHPDLAGKLRPGYDFVRASLSADGDGRDADASDPGDWSTAADTCGAADSSWHGTQVAGLIGAATNNGIGVAGLARNVMVLPVRVLGKCGGFDSDIIAGMLWAGGLSTDSSLPVNPYPARVINMSLGSAGSCGSDYQDAINRLAAAKVAVVVAAGNDTGHAVNTPANCSNAIAVAGLRQVGTKVGYSNIGPQVAVSAPAGNCVQVGTGDACLYPLLTTTNLGTTSAGVDGYSDAFNPSLGTSFAAPLVAGTAALMLSVDSSLTPAQIKSQLQASARAFPTTGGSAGIAACRAPTLADQDECYCSASTCGAGMLDTQAAVKRVADALLVPTAAIAVSSATPTVGSSVTLDGRGSSSVSGRSISSWQWGLGGGAGLASFVGATNGSTATLATSGTGTVTVTLTVTDSAGMSQTASTALTVQSASSGGNSNSGNSNSSGDSGGGALGAAWLLGLALALRVLAPASSRVRKASR